MKGKRIKGIIIFIIINIIIQSLLISENLVWAINSTDINTMNRELEGNNYLIEEDKTLGLDKNVMVDGEINDELLGSKYEYSTYGDISNYSLNDELNEEENQHYLGELNIKYLKLKTDSNYEVALAYENGDYIYKDSTENLEEAINLANESVTDETISDNIIPCVISQDGVVVYATNSIGRIVKIVNGKPSNDDKYTIYMYKDSNVTNYEYTYINHLSIDDVPIIETSGNMVKVQVSGYTGWIERSDSEGINIIEVPINQAINRSYYKMVDGDLVHYISSDITKAGSGYERNIGPAPSFMKSGVRYSSYDGKYFYNYSDINKLITDIATGSNNAINSKEPYYNYYMTLPARSKTSYTAAEINKYINAEVASKYGISKKSILGGMGAAFIKAQNSYGVNAMITLAIAMNESSLGTDAEALKINNVFGHGAIDENTGQATKFDSVEECIDEVVKLTFSNLFFNPKAWTYNGGNVGNKAIGANVRYASDPFWGEKAASYMYSMDKYLSGRNNLKEYNKYSIGMFIVSGNITNKNGEILYTIEKERLNGLKGPESSAKTGDFVIVLSNKDNKYEFYPDRNIPISSLNPNPGYYDWSKTAYFTNSGIRLINGNAIKESTDWKNHWAVNEIKYAMDNGWVKKADKFRPNDPITRAEFVKIVNKAFGYTKSVATENFIDVKKGDWFYDEVRIALKLGYISSKNESFRPNDPITREEVANIITTIKNNKDGKLDKLEYYKDKDLISSWARTSVEGAIEAGYMGKNSNMFNPRKNITRAEAVTTLYRVAR